VYDNIMMRFLSRVLKWAFARVFYLFGYQEKLTKVPGMEQHAPAICPKCGEELKFEKELDRLYFSCSEHGMFDPVEVGSSPLSALRRWYMED